MSAGLLHQLALTVENALDDHLVPAQYDGVRQDRPEDDTDAAETPDLQSSHLWAQNWAGQSDGWYLPSLLGVSLTTLL